MPVTTARTAAGDTTMPGRRWYTAVTLMIVALYGAWILALPCFPAEDGPVHVYYATVARSLLAGQSTFAASFRVAHRFPPYSLHAYLLMWLMRGMSGVMAEKAVACIALLAMAAGFAYFVARIGGNAALMTIVAIPFFAHRYLFIGFYGFSIGLGLALLAMGIWSCDDRARWPRRIAFVGVAWLTSFTHPVPYVLMLGYCATQVIADWRIRAKKASAPAHSLGADWLTLIAAAAALLYVAAYAHSGTLITFYSAAELARNLVRIVELLRLGSVLPLSVAAYTVPLRIVFVAAFAAATCQAWRTLRAGRFTAAQLALGWGIAVILVIPFAPDQLNGSYVFADRLAVWSVLMILAAASGFEGNARWNRAIFAAACMATLYSGVVLHEHMWPIAQRLDVSQLAPRAPAGTHDVLVHRSIAPPDLTYDPYTWAAVRIVEQQRGVLVAAPWMNLDIIMLKPTAEQKSEDDSVNDPVRISERLRGRGMVIVTRCGQPQPPPESWVRTEREWESRYYPDWKLRNYSCFGFLQP